MITFKEYLTEARMAPLYHASQIENIDSIMKKGFEGATYQVIYKGKGQASWGRDGVSFARSMRACDWYMRNEHGRNQEGYVIFQIDQAKLAQNYRIDAVDYFGTILATGDDSPYIRRKLRKETEEFVTVKKDKETYTAGFIPPKFIVAIHYFKTDAIYRARTKYPNVRWVERN